MPRGRVEVYRGRRGLQQRTQYYWRWQAGNGQIKATSGEGYNNHAECMAVAREVADALNIPLEDVSQNVPAPELG